MDWVTIWTAKLSYDLAFRPILEKLAKGAAEDFAKDFLKGCLNSVFAGSKDAKRRDYEHELTTATGQAMAAFLGLVQEELLDANLDDPALYSYVPPMERLINEPPVKAALAEAFKEDAPDTDDRVLESSWQALRPEPPALPPDFSWKRVCNRYERQVAGIRRGSDKLRELLDSQNLQSIADEQKKLVGVRPGFDLIGYAEALRERYAQVRLESMDVTGTYYRDLELWRVFIPQHVRECEEFLPQVFELPKEHLRRLKEDGEVDPAELDADEVEQLRRRYVEQIPRNVLELVDDPSLPLLVILGDPGSGKSSLVNALATRWASLPPTEAESQDVPLLIELRAYAQARQGDGVRDFLDFLQNGSSAPWHLDPHQVKKRLDAGRACVYFDGLDEVFNPDLRGEVVTAICRFSNEFPHARIIVTSRVIGYKGEDLRKAGFRHVMLQDLDDDQIASFLDKWHRDTYRPHEAGPEKQRQLAQAIADSRAIRELAGNPLLLTMMAILNRHQDLPRDRAQLYEQCARLLLHQWKVEEALRGDPDANLRTASLDFRDKQTLLRRVAQGMQTSDAGLAGNVISGQRLQDVLTEGLEALGHQPPDSRIIARALIRHLRERNFILCFIGANSYAFVHRTFLEYFCADDLRHRFESERTIAEDDLWRNVYAPHWTDEIWHETLCLLGGMISPAVLAGIIEHLLNEKDQDQTCLNVFLAARCVGEVRSRAALGQIVGQVLERTEALTGFDLNHYYDFWEFQYTDKAQKIRSQAVASVADVWRGLPQTREWLKQRAQKDDSYNVRQAAIQELARGWKDDPQTLSILKERAQKDDHPD
ncbi:MAG: NACHT domain-containing protein, partial [Phycisphaerae bacterium]|nr:NACHT domain-containing protein [Phycisphaerae bacterium]